MKLHERTMKVQAATAQLRMDMIRFQQKHDLTDIETLQALAMHPESRQPLAETGLLL
jgi:hypothetical protein